LTPALCIKITLPEGRAFAYDIDFIRRLCGDLAREKDPTKIHELMSLLRAVLKEDQEEVRIRVISIL
jgi:hypothetical protein